MRLRTRLSARASGRPLVVAMTLALGLAFASLPSLAEQAANERTAENCSPCVLILFLSDLNKQWHVMRAAAYSDLGRCQEAGRRVSEAMKGNKQPTSFYCLAADLP